MDILVRFYRTCNLLNLDVVAGTVISALFFSKLFLVSPHAPDIIVLGLTVWIIYTVDRLLDIRNLASTAASERHKFHQLNQRLLWKLIFCIGLIIIFLIFYLSSVVLWNGMYLSGAVVIYILLQKYLKAKEIVVALLYTAGVLLPGWSLRLTAVSTEGYLLITQLFIVALINLFLFSWFEYDTDQQDGHSSIAIRWGKKASGNFLLILSGINLLITLFLFIQYSVAIPALPFLLMTLVLTAIFKFHKFFMIDSRYRIVGDAVFIIPLLGILL